MSSDAIRKAPLRESFKVQGRILGALLVREVITRYGRHNIGFLWLFVEPMIFTLGVTALWTATKSLHGSDLPIAAFALTGYSTVLLWRNMPGR
jgi:ABC-2 type transport system permease protein/capsular polysaccharide transport system permease protein